MRRLVGKVIGTVLCIVLVVVVVRACVGGSDATIATDYYELFQSECLLEQRYSQLGPHEALQLDLPNEDAWVPSTRTCLQEAMAT